MAITGALFLVVSFVYERTAGMVIAAAAAASMALVWLVLPLADRRGGSVSEPPP